MSDLGTSVAAMQRANERLYEEVTLLTRENKKLTGQLRELRGERPCKPDVVINLPMDLATVAAILRACPAGARLIHGANGSSLEISFAGRMNTDPQEVDKPCAS